MPGAVRFVEHYQEWLMLYNEGWSMQDIAEYYGCAIGTVFHGLRKVGGKSRSVSEAVRRKKGVNVALREDFFEQIDTEEKAYWLGFLMADGCVRIYELKHSSGKRYQVSLLLQKQDAQHLEVFVKSIHLGSSLHYDRFGKVRVTVSSKKMVEDLIRHGCTPKKSLTLKFPTTVPWHLVHHFVRGYWDGDGWITHNPICWGLCGTEQFLSSVREHLMQILNLRWVVLISHHTTKGLYYLKYGGKHQVKKIHDWMYDGATLWLPRKRKRYEELIKLTEKGGA